tara:strand:+ start:224 stop:481 length:258 start_codon:yes stop_codon:yes gene_type:complete
MFFTIMVLLYYTLLSVISYMKKRDILIIVLGVSLLVSIIWATQGQAIKDKASEKAQEVIVEKVVDTATEKAKEKLKEEVLDKLLP